MSKRVSGADEIYANHSPMFANRRTSNPGVNRERALINMYSRVLTELACNRFKWCGLPDSVNVRFLELTLFHNALSVFYDDETFGFIAMPAAAGGQYNAMEEPTSYRTNSRGLYTSRELTPDECVPIWANYLRQPDLDIVNIFATRLANLDRTIEINGKNARRTRVLVVDENSNLSVTNINNQLDNGAGVVKTSTSLNGVIESIDLGVNPDSLEKLDILHTRQWGKCLGLMGIDFANQDKKERQVVDEVNANNAQVGAMRAVNLNERRVAADMISKKYGIKVQVEFNEELSVDDAYSEVLEGNYGDIHNDVEAG